MRKLVPFRTMMLLSFVAALLAASSVSAQNPSALPEMGGMVATSAGLLAITSPSGWIQTSGPCLANFAPSAAKPPSTSLCITSSAVESLGHPLALDSFVAEDVAAFRQRFPGARVNRENSIALPGNAQPAIVYNFESGDPAHNPFEQVAYIVDYRRVWIFTLGASTQSVLAQALPVFRGFVASYRGSIQFDGAK